MNHTYRYLNNSHQYIDSDESGYVITGASYYIYDDFNNPSKILYNPPILYCSDSETVTFYTFDGNPIVKIKTPNNLGDLYLKLDPGARNPQIVKFQKVYRPVTKLKSNGKIKLEKYHAILYDKNNNIVDWVSIGPLDTDIKSSPKYNTYYDLTDAEEEGYSNIML